MNKSTHQTCSFLLPLLLITFLLFSFSTAHEKPEEKAHSTPSPKPEDKAHSTPSPKPDSKHKAHSTPSPKPDEKHKPTKSKPEECSLKGLFPRVFAFGDSDTDTGNAPLLDGGTQMEKSGFINPVNAPNRLIVDFLCTSLDLPTLQPFMKPGGETSGGVSFAMTGSTSLSSDLFSKKNLSSLFWKGAPQSYQTQIDWFKEYIIKNDKKKDDNKGTSSDISNALFWVGQMGVSDYTSSAAGSSITFHKLAESSVKHVMEILTVITDNGGKSIIVQGLPPVGCCPFYMALTSKLNLDSSGCMQTINLAVMAHNKILQVALENFRKEHPDCTILYADYWSAYLAIVTHPEKYGIEEPFKACCGCGDGEYNFNKNKICGSPGTSACKDPSKYVHWDGVRLTESMNMKMTDMFLHKGYCQPSFDTLLKKKSKKTA